MGGLWGSLQKKGWAGQGKYKGRNISGCWIRSVTIVSRGKVSGSSIIMILVFSDTLDFGELDGRMG